MWMWRSDVEALKSQIQKLENRNTKLVENYVRQAELHLAVVEKLQAKINKLEDTYV